MSVGRNVSGEVAKSPVIVGMEQEVDLFCANMKNEWPKHLYMAGNIKLET